jgi:transitional endoplasmic reticulum ATPase
MAHANGSVADQNKVKSQALATLAKLGGLMTTEDDLVFEGRKFVIPENVKDLKQAVKILSQRAEDEETVTSFSRDFPYKPWDGAAATERAIREAFGFNISKPIVTFFGVNPPQMITINDGPGSVREVPWGALQLPGLENTTVYLGTSMNRELGVVFRISVEAPRKYKAHIQGLFMLIERNLHEGSIYRGKPIDGGEMPNFLDVSGVDPNDVIYTQEVMQQLEANVWSPLRHADALAALGQPGKRSVLLEGPYGTGKTLAAYLTAKVAQENGFTFILCRPGVDDLHDTLRTARMYQPAVVFFEDLDTVGSAQGTDDQVTRILDSFDGLQTKDLQMLLVLTTNHVERIHKGMIRPGRLDAVIHVGAMDRPGVERLVQRVIGDNLEAEIDFDAVFAAYDGFMPAFVREAIDRTVRYSVARHDGTLGMIGTEDLVLAAEGLRRQLDLMNGARDEAVRPSIESAIQGVVEKTVEGVGVIRDGYSPDEPWARLHVEVPEDVRSTFN